MTVHLHIHRALQRALDAESKKVTRDAFLYLEPSRPDLDQFSQCVTCGFFNERRERCKALREQDHVTAGMSCGYYREGEGTTDDPQGWFTPEQVGLVNRQVRCENCGALEGNTCDLYAKLKKLMPTVFDLDDKVNPKACCNAQHPK